MLVVVVPFILSTLAAFVCYQATGPTLGAFIGPPVLLALLLPPLVAGLKRLHDQLLVVAALLLPMLVLGGIATARSEVRSIECATSAIVLAAWAASLWALVRGLESARVSSLAVPAIVVTLALAWITWPIWTSPRWGGSDSADRIARWAALHPIVAINAQVRPALGNWTEQSVAYHLTEWNQNVPLTLPGTIWPAVLLHALLALVVLAGPAIGRRAHAVVRRHQP